jgi:hypothetical protein
LPRVNSAKSHAAAKANALVKVLLRFADAHTGPVAVLRLHAQW